MLLTHTSGIGGDLSHQGPWGLTAADKADGIHRALTAPLEFDPGQIFHYSDIGFIILGQIVEKTTGEPLDSYARDHIFAPLGMVDTGYLPASQACGPHQIRGTAVAFNPNAPAPSQCPAGTWNIDLLARVAPTARDEDTPASTPTSITLFEGPSMTRRHDGWAGWPAVQVCSPRRRISACTCRHYLIALPAGPARFR